MASPNSGSGNDFPSPGAVSAGNEPGLSGLRVLLTRPAAGAEAWRGTLEGAGATVLSYPTTEIVVTSELAAIDHALETLALYTGVIFTSATAVRILAERYLARGGAPFQRPWIAAVGTATAASLRRFGFDDLLVASDQRQEGLAALLPPSLSGARILFPQAVGGREHLVEVLGERGATVDVLHLYESRPLRPLPPLPDFDAVVFASPSALNSFCDVHPPARLAGRAVIVIGPTTASAARDRGLTDVAEAPTPSVEGVVSVLHPNPSRSVKPSE